MLSTTGQSLARITVPGPDSVTLNSPPAAMAPMPPLIILISYEIDASKPSRERDDADSCSPWARSSRCSLWPPRETNSSPLPSHRINFMPSPVAAALRYFETPPEPS